MKTYPYTKNAIRHVNATTSYVIHKSNNPDSTTAFLGISHKPLAPIESYRMVILNIGALSQETLEQKLKGLALGRFPSGGTENVSGTSL